MAFGLGIGLVALAVALVRPLSFDEAYWLTMGERILGANDLPYFDLLDNKGPLLYVLVTAAVALPVASEVGMGVLFAATCGLIGTGTWRLAAARGQDRPWRVFSVLIVSVAAMALSTWSLTTELLAVAAIIWAFSRTTPWARVVLVLLACLIDPRVVLVAPLVLIDGHQRGGVRRQHVVAFVAAAVVGIGVVLVVPDLRYAFVEASFATRFDANLRDVLVVGAAAMTPVVALAALRVRPFPFLALSVAAVGALIGISAGLPFGHYWVYVVLAVPLAQINGRRFSIAVTAVVGVGIVLVTSLATRQHLAADLERSREDEPAASAIVSQMDPDDEVLIWASSPLLRVPIAERTLGFAPTSNYFAWGLPNPQMLLDRLGDDLDRATVLVVGPDLDGYRHLATVDDALNMIEARVAQNACAVEAGSVVIYRLTDC